MKTRREFLQIAGAAATLAAVVPSALRAAEAAAPAKKRAIKKAIMWGTVGSKALFWKR